MSGELLPGAGRWNETQDKEQSNDACISQFLERYGCWGNQGNIHSFREITCWNRSGDTIYNQFDSIELEKANQLKQGAEEIEITFQENRSALLLVDDIMFQLLHELKNMLNFTAQSIYKSASDGTDLSGYLSELKDIENRLIELDDKMSTMFKKELSMWS